jgi:serine/threonine-protein kinase
LIGETIDGSYRITARIGSGAMGEVYRATDTRLGRDVAIKFSSQEFSERFEREARAVAALNHPNICTLYDVGHNYLVMELIEGSTLAELIAQGPMPLDEALHIARQIADALEAAHEANIVHRDLKPGNVKVKSDGTVKVLDFGLAKVGGPLTKTADSQDSPTLSVTATQAGMILGTAAYMSPEQARGKIVDKRADIWSFGVVLFEMLTGEPLFGAGDTSMTLASVIKDEPDWSRVPDKVRTLLHKCLEKDPKNRLRDIGDAALLLQEAAPITTARSRIPWMVAAALAAGLVIALFGWWTAMRKTEQALHPLARMEVNLGTGVALGSAYGADVIISPDGDRLVFVSQNHLLTRRLDQPKAVELAGTEDATSPFFSPNGGWIGFFAHGKLKKVPVDGGTVSTLCAAPAPRGGAWAEDGTIIAALNGTGGLSRIPEGGGEPLPFTNLDNENEEVTHRWPQIIPGKQQVVFSAHTTVSNFDDASIEVISLKDEKAKPKKLPFKGLYPRYLPSGHIAYLNRGTLLAVPMDLDRLEPGGSPVPVLEFVGSNATMGFAQYDFSRDGKLVYRSGGSGSVLVTIQWLDRSGNTSPLLAEPGYYNRIRFAPTGDRIAMTGSESSSYDIWVYNWKSGNKTLLTVGGIAGDYPVWSSDGEYIAFSEYLPFPKRSGIFLTRADGSMAMPKPLTESKNLQFPWTFTSDDRRLAFMEISPENGYDLWTVPIEKIEGGLKAGTPEQFLVRPADDRHPALSPDGHWLAYSSSQSGAFQIWVRPFPDKGGGQFLVGEGVYAVWSPNGRELFFRTEDNRIMVSGYTVKDNIFMPEKPRLWTETRIANVGVFRNYDLSPDGKSIAALMPANGPDAEKVQNHVTFLENFFDEVRRRIAGAGH